MKDSYRYQFVGTNLNLKIKMCMLPQSRANKIVYYTVAFSTRVNRLNLSASQ